MTPSPEWSAADDDDSDRATGHVPARNATHSPSGGQEAHVDVPDREGRVEACEPDANFMFCTTHQTASGDWPCSVGSADRAAQIARIAELEAEVERQSRVIARADAEIEDSHQEILDNLDRAHAAEVALAEARETLAKVAALPVSLMLREMASGRKPGPVADKARYLAKEFEDSLASAGRPSDGEDGQCRHCADEGCAACSAASPMVAHKAVAYANEYGCTCDPQLRLGNYYRWEDHAASSSPTLADELRKAHAQDAERPEWTKRGMPTIRSASPVVAPSATDAPVLYAGDSKHAAAYHDGTP